MGDQKYIIVVFVDGCWFVVEATSEMPNCCFAVDTSAPS